MSGPRVASWKRATDACVLASNNASPAQRGPRRDAQPLHATPLAAVVYSYSQKERKQPTQGRDGRTVRRHHTGILGEKCGVSRRPPSGVYHFLSLSAVCWCVVVALLFSFFLSPLAARPPREREPGVL